MGKEEELKGGVRDFNSSENTRSGITLSDIEVWVKEVFEEQGELSSSNIMTVGEYCKRYKEAEEWNKQTDTTKENSDGA
jgi:hypothetical protein